MSARDARWENVYASLGPTDMLGEDFLVLHIEVIYEGQKYSSRHLLHPQQIKHLAHYCAYAIHQLDRSMAAA